MSGSLLGRGRGGRLAVYGGCGVVFVLLVFLYRAATSEMARLRELHVQCAHQQEALAAQLQVIFEYKVRLEKSLAEEKTSNVAIKQELQQRASREKSLRDRDSIEAMQRFNSLQQTHKLLQTEHQDLQEECKKREKQALEDTNTLEATLKELRKRLKQARDDKETSMTRLKNEFLALDTQKTKLEQRYNEILKNVGNTDSALDHLKKKVIQLERELTKANKQQHRCTSPVPSIPNPDILQPEDSQVKPESAGNVGQPTMSSQQQQVSPPTNNAETPQPLHAPLVLQANEDHLQSNEQRLNEVDNVQFAQKNGNIVPVGPNEAKEPENTVPTSSMRSIPVSKLETSKAKLPVGVPPIPVMIDQKLEIHEEKTDEITRKKEEPKQKNNIDSKEKENENENLDPPFPIRRVADQVSDIRANVWINMDPGVQEIGEELNQIRLPGLDAGGERNAEGGDDHYEGVDYDKEPQQKNNDLQLVESEDEGEDEDDQIDYPHNLKQEKRE